MPLSVTAFATLSPALRSEGTAVYTLVRNLGSSVGISMMEALVHAPDRGRARRHGRPAVAGQPGAVGAVAARCGGGPGGGPALDMLNGEITRQASMVALVDVFRLMLVMTICIAPLLLIMRKPKAGAAGRGGRR